MAADSNTVLAMLGYVPLTTAVTQVMTQLPRPLPDPFYTQTKDVLGNKYRRFLFRGTRQPSLYTMYGAPPRVAPQTPIQRQDVVMISSLEQISAGQEIFELMHRYEDYTVVLNAEEELQRRANDFAERSQNLRTTCIHSAVALGKIYFKDSTGEILPSSSGATLTVDMGIPNSNRVTSSVDWSSPSADVTGYLSGFLTTAMQSGYGRKPVWAICGKNIQGYLANNTSFQQYLARNTSFNEYYKNNNWLADGVLGLKWVKAQDVYYERIDGSLATFFPDDQITFFPELTRDVYELKQGSQPVPTKFAVNPTSPGDFMAAIKDAVRNPVYGPFSYAWGQFVPIPQAHIVQGDTFFPDFPTPQAIWILDTKP